MTTMKNREIKYKKEIERLKDQLQQKENIMKEVREKVEMGISEKYYDGAIYDILEILDKKD